MNIFIPFKKNQNDDIALRFESQKNIGMRVQILRAQRGWSKKKLAQEARVSEKYVYDIEVGKKNMSIWVLNKIAKTLGEDISRILFD